MNSPKRHRRRPAESFLIGDIGGTYARFALTDSAAPGYRQEQVYRCADRPSLEDAIRVYLADVRGARLRGICLAVAGPVRNGAAELTNLPWQVAEQRLRAEFATGQVRLINDFQAVAQAIPLFAFRDCSAIGALPAPDLTAEDCRVAVVGPGTGLGAAGLLRREGIFTVLATEAGHQGFAPETPAQRELLARLQDRLGRVCDEDIASGNGLSNIHWALQEDAPMRLEAAEIFRRADCGDPTASRAVGLFFEALGQIAGNLALALGAFQGIYIAGGIVRRHAGLLRASRFRAGFENKGRLRPLMAKVPSLLIEHPQPGLLGASHAARAGPHSGR